MNVSSVSPPNTTEVGNTSSSTDAENWRRFMSAVITFQLCIICLAIAGNLLVCTAILLTDRLRNSTTNYFLFSLAISDILTAAFPMSMEVHSYFQEGQWDLGASACKFYTTMYMIAAPSSVINLLAVSVDRYRAIRRPLLYAQNMTPKKALIAIFLIWTYVIVFALVPLMGWNIFDGDVIRVKGGAKLCYFDIAPYYSVLSSVINFVLPMVIMSVIYYQIYKIAHEHARRIGRTETNFSTSGLGLETSALTSERKNIKRSIKAAKTIAIIVSAFFLSWMPHTAVSIAGIFCRDCFRRASIYMPYILILIAYTNSVMNPFLYAFHNRDFRQAFKKLLRVKRRIYR